MPDTLNVPPPETPPVATAPPAETPLIAGKFKTVGDLESAYKSLEAKLGKPAEPPPAPVAAPAPAPAAATAPVQSFVDQLLTKAGLDGVALTNAFATDGKLNEAQYAALLSQGVDQATADRHLGGVVATGTLAQAAQDRVKDEATALAGGEVQLDTVLKWAASSLTTQQLETYNASAKNPATAMAAFQGVLDAYGKANGTVRSPLVVGTQTSTAGSVAPFETRIEYIKAQREARAKYGDAQSSPEFRARLLATSKLNPGALNS